LKSAMRQSLTISAPSDGGYDCLSSWREKSSSNSVDRSATSYAASRLLKKSIYATGFA
jgi:hypothetical protein